mmetsp:Transcript_8863/g.27263  ORF Transcript_8863/g.27263 Transcript_8863/m.27263 type:complete len:427 (+) Transcript_8863:210-1490(+)
MTTDVNAKITELEDEKKSLKVEIEQVKAGLRAHAAKTEEARTAAFAEADLYADDIWTREKLQAELGRLRDGLTAKEIDLTELRRKENLLLEEARRAERASRDSMPGRGSIMDALTSDDAVATRFPGQNRFFKVSARFTKGATWRNLRKTMYELADQHGGIAGHIHYETPVRVDSDLDVLLYFTTESQANMMRAAIIKEWQEHYTAGARPNVRVAASNDDVDPENLITTSDYDRNVSPTRDDDFEGFEVDTESGSTATKNCPEHVQKRECIFDPKKCGGKVHEAHVNPDLKMTKKKKKDVKDGVLEVEEEDSKGNVIPLPSDVHQLFDDNLSVLGMPLISIDPLTKVGDLGTGDWENGDFFQEVKVRVYFYPDERAQRFISGLRHGNIQVSQGVYDVTIHKRMAAEFIKQAKKRHDETQAKWSEKLR